METNTFSGKNILWLFSEKKNNQKLIDVKSNGESH